MFSGPTWQQNNLSVNLDNDFFYGYRYPSLNSSTYVFQYNVLVFNKSSLSNKEHTVTMTTNQGTTVSNLLFDYATYT